MPGNEMIFGYARVSTQDQNVDRQLDELKAAGCQKIFYEKISGTKMERPEFLRMLDQVRSGDLIIITELTRLSRSTKDLLNVVEMLEEKGVSIKSLKESWLDTSSAHGKLLFTFFAGISQFERDIISERVKSGLQAARARGRLGGRKPADPKTIDIAVRMWKSKEYSINEILKTCGISRRTLYKYLKHDEECRKIIEKEFL